MKILEKGEKAIEDLQFKAEAYFIPGKILHYPFYFYIFEFYFTYVSIAFVQYSFSGTKYKFVRVIYHEIRIKNLYKWSFAKIFKFRKEKIERLYIFSFNFFYPIVK